MERAIVTFEPEGAVASVLPGTTIAEAARVAEVRVETPCAGAGLCGGCAVHIDGEVSGPTRDEERLLGADRLAAGVRLACRARAAGDVRVRITGSAAGIRVEGAMESLVSGFKVDPPGMRGLPCGGRSLGAAIDVGTTTLVASLIDLRNGDVLASEGAENPQAVFGADVLTRVAHAVSGGQRELRDAVVGQVVRMLSRTLAVAEALPEDLCEMAFAGNTAMVHLLLGIDVSPLAAAPYEGAHTAATVRDGMGLGMDAFAEAEVYVLPGVSAFVGADVVAGLVVTRLDEEGPPALLLDLGTNGEMVLRTPAGLVAASAAAGPAFEGGAIESGMRAEPGAIERAWLDGDSLGIAVIGDVAATGICGSGLVDIAACLIDAGALDQEGRLTATGPLADRIVAHGEQVAFRVDGDVLLTQKDIRALQLAKGAVAAGARLLLERAGVAEADVARVLVAGGFGRALQARSLTRIGMLPAAWEARVEPVGNTSHAGAAAALVSAEARKRTASVARVVDTLDLANDPAFEQAFLDALGFPAR